MFPTACIHPPHQTQNTHQNGHVFHVWHTPLTTRCIKHIQTGVFYMSGVASIAKHQKHTLGCVFCVQHDPDLQNTKNTPVWACFWCLTPSHIETCHFECILIVWLSVLIVIHLSDIARVMHNYS